MQQTFAQSKLELEEQLRSLKGTCGDRLVELVPTQEKLALLCHRAGQYEEAANYYKSNVEILEKSWTYAGNRAMLIKAYHYLGLLHRIQGSLAEAEPHYRKALELAAEQFGEKHTETAFRRNYLAGLYFAWSKYEQAENLLKSSLSFYEQSLGKDHEVTAVTLYALALVTRRSSSVIPEELAEADSNLDTAPLSGGLCKEYYERSVRLLNIKISSLSMEDHHDLFLALLHLSSERFAEGKFEEAEELFRHCLLMELQEIWPKHPLITDSYQLLGDIYRAFGMNSQAEYLYRFALDVREEVYGSNHAKVGASAYSLGTFLTDAQRYDEAEALLKKSCAIHRSNAFPPVLANSLRAYAKALQALGKDEEARHCLEESDRIFAQHADRGS